MIQKVAFSMYPVQDGKRARAFYGDVLGLPLGMHSPDGVWTEYDLPQGGCLALFQTKDLQPSSGSGGSVALEVDDLDATIAELKGKGVTFKVEMIHGPKCRMSVILDSEGNALTLHQLQR